MSWASPPLGEWFGDRGLFRRRGLGGDDGARVRARPRRKFTTSRATSDAKPTGKAAAPEGATEASPARRWPKLLAGGVAVAGVAGLAARAEPTLSLAALGDAVAARFGYDPWGDAPVRLDRVPVEDLPIADADVEAHAKALDMWNDRWERGATGWHLSKTNHHLVRHKTALLGEGVTSPPETSRRVFVPLCGKSVDMLWLAACGHRVYGVEVNADAARAFFDENGLPRTTLAADRAPGAHAAWAGNVKRVHTAGNIAVIEGDLFSLRASPDPRPDGDAAWRGSDDGDRDGDTKDGRAGARGRGNADLDLEDARVGARMSISFGEESMRFAAGGGPAMDAVWDKGALVAIEPSLRPRYARLMYERMAPGAKMLVVGLSYDPVAESGSPPHNVPTAEVQRLYEPLGMTVRLLATEEVIDTVPPRIREKVDSVIESAYLVTKPRAERRRSGRLRGGPR